MKALWQSEEIADAVNGIASASFSVEGVAFDSREIKKNDLFLALKGEQADGHNYIKAAFEKGASGVLTMQPTAYPHVLVEDTHRALEALGQAGRRRNHGKIIGITGSVGKTSVKEALRLALKAIAPDKVHSSLKSYNNHVGVPLSLARMPKDSRFGIFEMGMNHAGELSQLTQWVRPDIALVTAIAPAHAAFFRDEAAIAEAKGEIFEGLQPSGIAIIPYDSPYRDQLMAKAKKQGAEIRSFGFGEGATIRAQDVIQEADGRILVRASLPNREIIFPLSMSGHHWVSNAMAVLAVVDALETDITLASLALGEVKGLAGRGQRFFIPIGEGQATIIDESYNANPASMAATIAVLGNEKKSGQRIALLGDMRELGENSPQYHTALADPLSRANVSHAILVGEEMKALAKALTGKIACDWVPDANEAEAKILNLLKADDVVLIKGSNSLGLSNVVSSLAKRGHACSI
ncbi:MAG: UDP-N-acetylmuramoyl-tripeptide--D-alanyl-D-alanine ligase [Zymomonas mobilis subsp. pomaceae]|uniref:UDP-N-acetylmuramoyl-tripeptide--D-alanyl-D- alanine ligase n=1 Tax=Zymomonas mobilis TaxID=542 RepID=UPI0039ED79AA